MRSALDPTTRDAQLRQGAFEHVTRLAALNDGVLSSDDLAAGFRFQGERIPLINPQRGIFKPQQMSGLLSIRTVFPAGVGGSGMTINTMPIGRSYDGDEILECALMGTHGLECTQ